MEISCPSCAAPAPVGALDLFLTCPACDSRLACFRGAGQRHLMLPARVDAQGAAATLVAELERRAFDDPPEQAEAQAVALPFWRASEGPRTLFRPAHASPDPETEAARLSGGEELLAFDPDALAGFEVLEPTRPPPAEADGPADLIHVPVWVLRYRVDGTPAHALVHAGDGRLLDFAGPPRRSAPRRLMVELVVFALLYTLLTALLSGLALAAAALLLAAALSRPPPVVREMR